MKEGLQIYKHDNGQVAVKCNYVKNKLHGDYELYDKDGNLEMKTSYRNGKIDGSCIKYDSKKGTKTIVHFKDGDIHGSYEVVKGDLVLESVNYVNGQKHGVEKKFSVMSGNLLRMCNYLYGKKNGLDVKYNINGVIVDKKVYIQG